MAKKRSYVTEKVRLPKITIAVIQSRKNHSWWMSCVESLRNQVYPDKGIDFLKINNLENKLTIGQAWNMAVSEAKTDWILFVGDDDILSPDYVRSLSVFLTAIKENDDSNKIAGVTSFLTAFADGYVNKPIRKTPTGIWSKKVLEEIKFDESLEKKVDTDFVRRIKEAGYIQPILEGNYGYFYRQHENQVSGGNKFKLEKRKEDERANDSDK